MIACQCRLCRDELVGSTLLSAGRPSNVEEYNDLDLLLDRLRKESPEAAWAGLRWLTAHDIFFSLTRAMTTRGVVHEVSGLPLFERQFCFERCREIEEDPGAPDEWGRGMVKSRTKTTTLNIMRALRNPDIAIAIFSYQKLAAKKHLRTIRDELQINKELIALFPEVLYTNPRDPQAGCPCWSLEEGLCLKRATTRAELTFEAHALNITTLPTGSHFDVIDMDDVEDDKAVKTPESIEDLKTAATQARHLVSTNPIHSFTGTPYHENGLVKARVRAAGDRARVYPGEDLSRPGPGPLGGTPQFYTTEELFLRYELMLEDDPDAGLDNYAKQICLDTRAGTGRTLRESDLRYYDEPPHVLGRSCTVIICQDPSMGLVNATATVVWGLLPDRRVALLDASFQRFLPNERLEDTWRLVARWQPISQGVKHLRIEQFGQADYVEPTMRYLRERGLYMPVFRVANTTKAKNDRIYSHWQPALRENMILLPRQLLIAGDDGKRFDVVDYFIREELTKFPRPITDDLLDAGALLWENPKRLKTIDGSDHSAVLSYPLSSAVDDDEDYDSEHARGTWAGAGVM